jgi:hypothetical protein
MLIFRHILPGLILDLYKSGLFLWFPASSQNSKALFGEVIVESKGGIELMLSHGGKTDAINQLRGH